MSTNPSGGTVMNERMTYEGGRNVAYDTMGSSREFLKSATYVHYKDGDQVIELPVPVFIKSPGTGASGSPIVSLIVHRLDESVDIDNPSVTQTPIEYVEPEPGVQIELSNNEWTYDEEDQTAMAKAFLLWNRPYTFNGVIARKIRVNVAGTVQIHIKIDYQAFYKDMYDTADFHAQTGPAYTRELGQSILDKLDELENKTAVVTKNMFGKTDRNRESLKVDLTSHEPDNWVEHELHVVDTNKGQYMIAPSQGAFYPGVRGTRTEFRMCKLHTVSERISEDTIRTGSRNGWLFIYTSNRIKTYVRTAEDEYTFDSRKEYFCLENTGAYRKLVMGTAAEVEARTADYYPGMSVTDFSKYICLQGGKFLEDVDYYTYDAENDSYDPATVTVGADITPGIYYIFDTAPVYHQTVSRITDTHTNYESGVNDATAVITQENKVVLTADNVSSYFGYWGTMVDIGLKDEKSKELVLGVDYEFADVDMAKTGMTYSTQPVYNHVRLLHPEVTDGESRISISYQAFGGEVTVEDIRGLRQDLANVMSILGEHHLLTVENLGKQPTLMDLMSRVRRMEDYHNHFSQVDHVVSKESDGFNWINIATIYDTAWFSDLGTEKPVSEIGTFRVSSRDMGWCYEFTVKVDLSKTPDQYCMSVKTLGAKGIDLNNLEDWDKLTKKERLGLRLCWNDDGKTSGCVLQLGWDYNSYEYDPETSTWATDTVTVTNRSGSTSMWRLYSNPLETTIDADHAISVYGHVRYVPWNGTKESGKTYFRKVTEYLYHLTGDTSVRSGVNYYKKNASTGKYELDSSVVPGTAVIDVGYDLYERSVYKDVYVQADPSEEVGITYYVVDKTSFTADNTAFNFLNGDPWEIGKSTSKYSSQYLEDDAGGVTVWLGVCPLKEYSFGPNTELSTLNLRCCLSSDDQKVLDATMVTSATVLVYDRKVGRYIVSSIPMCSFNDGTLHSGGEGLFFFEDMCGMSIELVWVEAATVGSTSIPAHYDIKVEAGLGTSSWMNDRFDLRQIKLHF